MSILSGLTKPIHLPRLPCSSASSVLSLESLPHLRNIRLLKILRVLIAQLVACVLDSLVNSLFAADTDDRPGPLLDHPGSRDGCHADVVPLRDLLDALDDLLIDLVFSFVYEVFEEGVGRCALGGAVGPGTSEGAAGDWGPGNKCYACVLTVGNLIVER